MAKKRVHRSGTESINAAESAAPATPASRTSGQRAAGGRSANRTGRPGKTARAADRPGLRAQFEEVSAPFLLRMRELPGFLLPVVFAIMLFFGLVLASPWAGILLILIGLFLSWLTAVSWPAISSGSRVLRVAVDLGMLVLGVLKLLGRI